MVVIRTASNSIRPIRIKTKIKRDPDPKSKGLGIRIRHTLSDVLYSVLVNGLTWILIFAIQSKAHLRGLFPRFLYFCTACFQLTGYITEISAISKLPSSICGFNSKDFCISEPFLKWSVPKISTISQLKEIS